MDVLALVHGDGGGPSLFAEEIEGRGHKLVEVRLHRDERPERPPSDYGAVLVLGGTAHPYEDERHPWLGPEVGFLMRVLEEEIPALGICLGAELFTRAADGQVERMRDAEIGWFPVDLTEAADEDPLFSTLPHRFASFQWHEYSAGVPPGGIELARNAAGPQAYRIGKAVWGVQFHPEVRFDQLVGWIRSYGAHAPVQPELFVTEARRHIGAWNEIGRELCTRFLDFAARA